MHRSLFIYALVFMSVSAHAYTPTVMSSGQPIRWQGDPSLQLALNTSNTSGLSAAQANDALVRSLQRWQEASGGRVKFNVWSGTDRSVYEPNRGYNGLSSFYFASSEGSSPGSNVLGVTEVWYDTRTGAILEVDTVLNDLDYQFTSDPRDTTGSGSSQGPSWGQKPRVFVENVMTHELGHSVGLSHSASMQSSMLYVEAPEQAHLGCDDQTGVQALYPTGAARGSLAGRVIAPSGQPVFGAHVMAISRSRGTVVGTGLTDREGRYHIAALEEGTYFVMIEPFYPGARALPSYYTGANAQVCGGSVFARTPILENPFGKLKAFFVRSGQTQAVPQTSVSCESLGEISGGGSARSPASPEVLFDGSLESGGFGGVDRFSFSGTRYYELRNLSGRLEIHALSYSLYSPMRARVMLYDAQGSPVSGAQIRDTVYEGQSGFVNYDSEIVVSGLAPGTYYVGVSAESLAPYLYPGGSIALDTVPYVVFTGTINGTSTSSQATLPQNARCRSSESFTPYQSPGGPPPRGSIDGEGLGFCGSIEKKGVRYTARTPLVIGWFLPWAAMLALGRLFVRRPWRKMRAWPNQLRGF